MLSKELGMIGGEYLAIDGEKNQVNASYRKSKNVKRIKKEYKKIKEGIKKLLAKEANEYLAEKTKEKRVSILGNKLEKLEKLRIVLDRIGDEEKISNMVDLDSPGCQKNSVNSISKIMHKRKKILYFRKVFRYDTDEKILVAEQIVKGPNNIHWHPGMLFKDMMKYNRNVHYLELAFNPDDLDKKNLTERIDEFDTIVVTDYFVRGKVPNNYFAEEVIKLAKEKSKKVVVIANTPYAKFSVPDSADTVVLTFATSPDNIEVVAGVLFGKIKPEGVWPIEYKLPE